MRLYGLPCAIGLLCLSALYPQSDDPLGQRLMEEAIEYLRQSRYEESYSLFNIIRRDDRFESLRAESLVLFAQSAIAINRLEEAADALELFIAHYSDHEQIADAFYHRARLFYLTGKYSEAGIALENFRRQYPDSEYVGNSYYWSGEALLATGEEEQAYQMFSIVVEEYQRSYRIEAARYQLSLIDLSRRENDLLDILRWSHEEYLALRDDVDEREAVADDEVPPFPVPQVELDEESTVLTDALQAQLRRLTSDIEALERGLLTTEGNEEKMRRLIEIKEQLQSAKDRVIRARSEVEDNI